MCILATSSERYICRGQLKCEVTVQKPDFVFRRNGRVHLNRRGRQFSRLLAAEVCVSNGSNAGYTMFRGSVKGTGYPLHSPVTPSLPLPTSPCAIAFQLQSTDTSHLSVCHRTDITQKNRNPLFTYQVQTWFCVPMTPVYFLQDTWLLCWQSVSFGTSSGESWRANEWWERYHNDQANIWQVSSKTYNFQIKPLVGTVWQYSVGSSHKAQLSAHLWERYFKTEFIPLRIHSCNLATIVFVTLTAKACFILMSFHSNANYTFHGTKNGDGNTVRVE
jgi:hypothetical protein